MKIALSGRLLLLVLCVSTGMPISDVAAEEPRVAKRHPALRLPTIDGTQTIDLRDLGGKKVLLLQFASW